VQALPSLQLELFGLRGLLHCPVTLSHTPALWHWFSAVHTTASPPTQAPDWHVSALVQASASSQLVPFGSASGSHSPVSGTQLFFVHESPLGAHTTGVPT
jgi:hypothetical protein